jgi:hypothetical protein
VADLQTASFVYCRAASFLIIRVARSPELYERKGTLLRLLLPLNDQV